MERRSRKQRRSPERSRWDVPLLKLVQGPPPDTSRSHQMSRVPLKHSKPELALRRALAAEGVRYRLHPTDLPGRPDIVNRRARVAVFVDGCFWHGCPDHFRLPKTRAEFWKEKIRRNQANRYRHLEAYGRGWQVFEIYECKLRDARQVAGWASKVARAIKRRPRASSA